MKRLTGHSSKPLGLLVPDDEKIVRRDPRQRDDEADPRAERVGVERKGDHEETCEGEQRRDEQRHLERSTGASHLPAEAGDPRRFVMGTPAVALGHTLVM